MAGTLERCPGGARGETSVREQFVLREETFHLGSSGLRGIGGMADIDHHVDAEIAADGALVGLARIGGAEEGAHAGDGVIARQGEGDDGGLLHEFANVGEERFGRDVSVMFLEQGIGELEHLDASNFQAGGFEPGESLTDESFADGVGFEENERGFVWHGDRSLANRLPVVNSRVEGQLNGSGGR